MSQASLRERAEFFCLALAMDFIANETVVEWADRNILALEDPPIELIEISLAGKLPCDEVMRLLKSIPGAGDLTLAAHQALSLLHAELVNGSLTLDSAENRLWAYQQWATIPEVEKDQVIGLCDALVMASIGYEYFFDDIRAEVLDFLAKFSYSTTRD